MGKLKLAVITPGTFHIPSAGSSSVETVVEQVALRLKERLDVTVYGRRGERIRGARSSPASPTAGLRPVLERFTSAKWRNG